MIHWLKALLWPCKHGVKVLHSGVVAHKSLLVSATHTSNIYRCTITCRRCHSLVMRFEGTIKERDEKRDLSDLSYPVIIAPPGVKYWETEEWRNWLNSDPNK